MPKDVHVEGPVHITCKGLELMQHVVTISIGNVHKVGDGQQEFHMGIVRNGDGHGIGIDDKSNDMKGRTKLLFPIFIPQTDVIPQVKQVHLL